MVHAADDSKYLQHVIILHLTMCDDFASDGLTVTYKQSSEYSATSQLTRLTHLDGVVLVALNLDIAACDLGTIVHSNVNIRFPACAVRSYVPYSTS